MGHLPLLITLALPAFTDLVRTMKVLITGITNGLGRALAEWLLDQGHEVAGCGRDPQALQSLREANCFVDQVDVRDWTAVEKWAKDCSTSWGVPDLLLNNAAIINQPAPLWEIPVSSFSDLIDINIKGVFHVSKAFLPLFLQRGSGILINFSSGWGRSVSPEVAPYCTSKWAIEGMTAALAQELPNGIAAAAVNPGVIDTPMLRTCFGESAGAYPDAPTWARTAGPFLTGLTPACNGQALTIS